MQTRIKMQFDSEIAKDVGVEEAIMYANIEYWCGKNEVNNKHFHDGHYWTYNSKNAFVELFPFWTEKQIERILNNLKKKKYIKIGNYNKVKYDRTNWYTITPPNGGHGLPKRGDGTPQTVRPIPNDKPNNKLSIYSKKSKNSIFFEMPIKEKETYLNNLLSSCLLVDEIAEIEKFASYWTESNTDSGKQRWQFEKTFDVVRRFRRWLANNKEWKSKSGKKYKSYDPNIKSQPTSNKYAHLTKKN